MQYKDIGKKIKDFFDFKKYDLQRQAVFKVKSDDVRWEIQTKLKSNGTVSSSLEIAHSFNKEEFMFKTITDKAPIFCFKSFRFQPKFFKVKVELQDPKLKISLNRKHEKYTVDMDTEYEYPSSKYSLKLAFAYNAIQNFSFGVKTEFKGDAANVGLQPCDYNIAISYDRNEDQTFGIATEKCGTLIAAGACIRVREDYTGYAQVCFNRAAGAMEERDDVKEDGGKECCGGPLGFGIGINRKLSENSDISAVFRSNQCASVMYNCSFPDCNVKAKVGANFKCCPKPCDTELTYKIIFG